MKSLEKIAIIGGGAWGTALATSVQRAGKKPIIWAREEEVVESINRYNENKKFLPGISLHKDITATRDHLKLAKSDLVIIAAPAQHMRTTVMNLSASFHERAIIVICTKGIEIDSGSLMSELIREIIGHRALAILSGPTFAQEVASGLPCAVTLACTEEVIGKSVLNAIGSLNFRPYLSPDVIGTQVGGALKNIIAIAAGIAIGRQLGENARAAIVTRGFAEIKKLAIAKGASSTTLSGLSGLGDLILTCSSKQSRNFLLGYHLGQNKSFSDLMRARNTIAEGVSSAPAAIKLGRTLSIELPICQAVNDILHKNADIDKTVSTLLSRPFRQEF